MNFVEYLVENYIWLLAVVIVIIITIIGFIADRRSNKRRKKKEKGDMPINKEPVLENITVEEPEVISELNNNDNEVPEFVMGPEVPDQINILPNDRIDEIKVEEPIEVVEASLPENPSFMVLDNSTEVNNNVIPDFPEMPQINTPSVEVPVFEPAVGEQKEPDFREEPVIPVVPLIEPTVKSPAFDLNVAPILTAESVIENNDAPVLNSWSIPNEPVENEVPVNQPEPIPAFDLNPIPTIEPIPMENSVIGESSEPIPAVVIPVVEPEPIVTTEPMPSIVNQQVESNEPNSEQVKTADIQNNDVWKL